MFKSQLQTTNKGAFSLIELMVVIGIVSVLAAIAVPYYKSYVERAKMTEATSLIQDYLQLWVNTNETGNWFNWQVADRYRPDVVPYMSAYVNWANVSLTFNPGYFNRQATTWVIYRPVLDGQPINLNQDAHQLEHVNTISWSCDVGGVGGVYYGGATRKEFQETYFPSCTCNNC